MQLPPVVGTVLAARGITTREAADRFYKPHLETRHDPLLLPGMDRALQRTREAIANRESIRALRRLRCRRRHLRCDLETCARAPGRKDDPLPAGSVQRGLRAQPESRRDPAGRWRRAAGHRRLRHKLGRGDSVRQRPRRGRHRSRPPHRAPRAAGRAGGDQPEDQRLALPLHRARRGRRRLPLPAGAVRVARPRASRARVHRSRGARDSSGCRAPFRREPHDRGRGAGADAREPGDPGSRRWPPFRA